MYFQENGFPFYLNNRANMMYFWKINVTVKRKLVFCFYFSTEDIESMSLFLQYAPKFS